MENSYIIDNLLEQQKGRRLEFKATVNKEAIAKTITAFINTEGGDLLLGVDDNKKIVGVENSKKVFESIQKMLVKYIQPMAPIFTQVVNYRKKNLILISVWEGANKPYQFKGKIFLRENDATKLSSVSNLTSLIKDRKEADFHWERRTLLGSSLQDLDTEEINQTIALYKAYKPNSVIEDAEDFLIQMGLIQNGNLSNACMVLFGKKPIRYIPQSKIRITIYPSYVSGDIFLNDKTFDGNLFQNITDILNFIEISFGKNIVVDGIFRKEKLNYPLLAVREGLLNAMIHRDYNSVHGFLHISIFSNRTEISNYGGLPEGITIKDLKREHSSILRNPDIAQICFVRKYIEMLGSGTLRMISDCKANGFRVPVWTDKDNVTTVIFPDLSIKTKATKGTNEGVNEGVSEGVKKISFKAESEGVNDELNVIYSIIEKTPGLKAPAIASTLGVSLSTAERYIRKLKEAKYIKFVGVPKTGGYYIA